MNELRLFPIIMGKIKKKFQTPNNHCIKTNASGKLLSIKKVEAFSDEEKVEFVRTLLLINGVIDSTEIKNIDHKRLGTRNCSSISITLPFEGKEKEEYISFRNKLVGINTTSRILDEVLEPN